MPEVTEIERELKDFEEEIIHAPTKFITLNNPFLFAAPRP